VDKEGQFHKATNFNDAQITQFFSREVFLLLLRKQLINQELVQKILSWRYTGDEAQGQVVYQHGNSLFPADFY